MGARLPHSALARLVLCLAARRFVNVSGPGCPDDRALVYGVKAVVLYLEAVERAGVKINFRLPRDARIVAELP